MAMMYFDLGKIDLANIWLEKAIERTVSRHFGALLSIKNTPMMAEGPEIH